MRGLAFSKGNSLYASAQDSLGVLGLGVWGVCRCCFRALGREPVFPGKQYGGRISGLEYQSCIFSLVLVGYNFFTFVGQNKPTRIRNDHF